MPSTKARLARALVFVAALLGPATVSEALGAAPERRVVAARSVRRASGAHRGTESEARVAPRTAEERSPKQEAARETSIPNPPASAGDAAVAAPGHLRPGPGAGPPADLIPLSRRVGAVFLLATYLGAMALVLGFGHDRLQTTIRIRVLRR